jgi:peroxiredoxin
MPRINEWGSYDISDSIGGTTVSLRNYIIVGLALGAIVLAGCGQMGSRQAGVAAEPTGIVPVLIGTKVPATALFAPDGTKVDVATLVASRPTILVIYRGDWCVYCQKQLEDLQRIEPELLAMGYQIVAVSPDPPDRLRKSIENRRLRYQLLSDTDLTLIKRLGLAYNVDDRTRLQLESFGVTPRNVSAQPDWMLPVPAVFLVSSDGRIRWEYVNPDYRERVPPDLLLAAAKALAEKRAM